MLTNKIANRMGFAAALDPEISSAYIGMVRFGLSECTDDEIVRCFKRGYKLANKIVQSIGGRTKVVYEFESLDQAGHFKI